MPKHKVGETELKEKGQERFASRILQGLYYPFEFPIIPESIFLFAALISVFGFLSRFYVNDSNGSKLFFIVAVIHLTLGIYKWSIRKKNLSESTCDPLLFCAMNKDKSFNIKMFKEEEILLKHCVDSSKIAKYRLFSGFLMSIWGILLGGLPVVMLTSIPKQPLLNAIGYIVIVIATLLGTLVFGRGLRTLIFTRFVKEVVVTNQRLIFPVYDGVLVSYLLNSLNYKPLVIERVSGEATLALDIRPQNSVAPLGIYALLGVDNIPLIKAKELAQRIVDLRK